MDTERKSILDFKVSFKLQGQVAALYCGCHMEGSLAPRNDAFGRCIRSGRIRCLVRAGLLSYRDFVYAHVAVPTIQSRWSNPSTHLNQPVCSHAAR